MNTLKVFNYESNEVRTVMINGNPWWVFKDICEVFGETNYRRTVSNLPDDEKGVSQMNTPGGLQNMTVINESGLYSVLFAMQPQKARGVSDEYIAKRVGDLYAFRRWATHDVLPTIRKTGGYVNNEDAFIDTYLPFADDNTKEMFRTVLHNTRQLNEKIERDKPKVLFADAVSTASTSILIGELAKLINQNGIDIGQNRLFEWLRSNGYLIRSGNSYNMPTQKAMDLKLFEVKERVIICPDGASRITRTVTVTGKGQQYFVNKFLS